MRWRHSLESVVWLSLLALALPSSGFAACMTQQDGQKPNVQEQDGQERDGQEQGGQEPGGQALAAESVEALREGILVRVPLPVNAGVASQLTQVISRHLESTPPNDDPKTRPVMVLEFDTSNGRNGRGSEFEACLLVARMLTSAKINRVETVAYIPGPKGIVQNADIDSRLESQLLGHPVLIALACNHIAMHVDAEIGQAGIDEEFVDDLVVTAYRSIAEKRLTLPPAVAQAMVDPGRSLFRIQSTDGNIEFADRDRLSEMESQGKVVESDTLTEAGSLPLFSSTQLINYQLIRQRTTSRRQISRQFNVVPRSLEGDPTLGEKWQAVQVNLDRILDQKTVSWMINALQTEEANETNLIIVNIGPEQVDVFEAIRLARHLASYDPNQIRTIAYVPRTAPGAAGIVALACDHLVMAADAKIGGQAVEDYNGQFQELRGSVQEIAKMKNRDWSLFVAMMNPLVAIRKYRQKDSSQIRLMSVEEHDALSDRDKWLPLDDVSMVDGIDGKTAEQYFVARYLVDDFEQLKSFYRLDDEPKTLEPTVTDRWIENLAGYLASPMIAFWLLFGAMFFLSSEMSQPGVGIPGFIGSVLLLLFFWSQFLDGNADWFEIIMFAAGVIFILIEIFLIPGLGIFGIGGLLMIVVSIVLATQSFAIPRNSEELRQFPISLLMVFGAVSGCVTAIVVVQRFLPHLPFLNRLMLHPPETDPAEGILDNAGEPWSYLAGKSGQAITKLMPTGKARFGDEIVSVTTDGRPIEKGESIRVIQVQGNLIRVESLTESPPDEFD